MKIVVKSCSILYICNDSILNMGNHIEKSAEDPVASCRMLNTCPKCSGRCGGTFHVDGHVQPPQPLAVELNGGLRPRHWHAPDGMSLFVIGSK